MKKTLQRELKVQTLPNDEGMDNKDTTDSNVTSRTKHFPLPPSSIPPHFAASSRAAQIMSQSLPPHMSNSKQFVNSYQKYDLEQGRPSPAPCSQCGHELDDANFQYLKHVVLKFMLSREHEVGNFNTGSSF